MITKFKIFEQVNELPNIGDYVLMNINYGKETQSFFEKNIGQITHIEKKYKPYDYIIKFNITDKKLIDYMSDYFDIVTENDEFTIKKEITDIKYWSDSKEQLEDFIVAKKYNI